MIIKNELDYQSAFQKLEKLIADNFEGNTEKEAQFSVLSKAIERYERDVLKLFPIRSTKDIAVFLKSLMSHKKLKVNELATILQISEVDLIAIIQYKKPFTFEYAERLKLKFDIDAPFVLQSA
jgi:HTH-type transcriptional regulator / antitoxin HigA